MEFRNLTPFDTLCYSALDPADEEHPVIAMKVGYRLEADDQHPGRFLAQVMDDEAVPLCLADRHYGEPDRTGLVEESDLAPYKPRCDVLIIGHSHAPQGQAAAQWEAGIRISTRYPVAKREMPAPPITRPGQPLSEEALLQWQAARDEFSLEWREMQRPHVLLDKRLRFTGPRNFRYGLLGWTLEKPQPALQVPLRWEYAFGGSSRLPNPAYGKTPDAPEYLLNEVCFSNPLGCGWIDARYEALSYEQGLSVEQLPAPQIETLDNPVKRLQRSRHPSGDLDARRMAELASQLEYQPAGFGALGRSWAPRLALAGTYDDVWLENKWPGLPSDFDFGYWNGAQADQQIEHPPPGLHIELENLTSPRLTSDGRLSVTLPKHRPFILLRLQSGVLLPLPMVTDTVHIDTDAMVLSLTHRISVPGTLSVRVIEARFETDPKAPLIKFKESRNG